MFYRIAFNEDEDEYEYEDIRYLFNEIAFNENDDEDVKDIRYLSNEDEDENKESSFKSIIADFRNKLSKTRDRLIEKCLYYVE